MTNVPANSAQSCGSLGHSSSQGINTKTGEPGTRRWNCIRAVLFHSFLIKSREWWWAAIPSAWGRSAVNSLRNHSCCFSCSTFIWSLWKFVRQFGKIIILGALSAFQLTQKPWSLGLTSTDRSHVLGKSQLAESLPRKYGKDGKYKHWWTFQQQESQDGDLHLCYLSVLGHSSQFTPIRRNSRESR